MSLNLLNLKANGVCPHQLKMVPQVMSQQLQLELQAQIKPKDDREVCRRTSVLNPGLVMEFKMHLRFIYALDILLDEIAEAVKQLTMLNL